MSREIKFRAWQFPCNRMLNWSDLTQWDYDNTMSFCSACEDQVNPKKEFALMQYTGIKDRTGKEIYEGDILYRKSTGTTGEVMFYKGKFIIKWKPIAGYVMYDSDVDTAERNDEVKGNIYENPDLIKI